MLTAFIFLIPIIVSAIWQTDLVHHPTNPVFDPATRAYYPSTLYDADGFGNSVAGPFYKMWYSDGSGISVVESSDGISWSSISSCNGLTNPHHNQTIYNANGFGNGPAGPLYKMWYWDTSQLYDVSAIRYAESNDGINWTNDQAVTQATCPNCIIDNSNSSNWNRGSYGPISMFFNDSATNSGTDPFAYSYVMYYDATTGGIEQIGLGYSTDGLYWTIADPNPVLSISPGQWDSTHVGFGSVIKKDTSNWELWYSGGTGSIHQGIGYATSIDGINWTKDPANPFITTIPGTWISQRAYTPAVIYDTNRFSGHGQNSNYKMWISGRDDGGNYSIGYYGNDVAILTYDTSNNYPETSTNNGAIDNSNPLTITLTNDTFQDTDADDLLDIGSEVTINNVPPGLTPVVTLSNSDNIATLTFTGSATSHTDANDVSDLTFEFDDSAFVTNPATLVVNATGPHSSNWGIDFNNPDPPPVPPPAPSTPNPSSSDSSILLLYRPRIISDGGQDKAEIKINENQTAVTTVEAKSSRGNLVYSIYDGDDAKLFNIDNQSGKLEFQSAPDYENPLDYNQDNTYEIVVRVDNSRYSSGLFDMQLILIHVQDIEPENTNCTINCSQIDFDVYIINPDGSERHTDSEYVLKEIIEPNITLFKFEDYTDMDFDDVLVQLDNQDCRQTKIKLINTAAELHHHVVVKIYYQNSEKKDTSLWLDSHQNIGKEIIIDLANDPTMCPE